MQLGKKDGKERHFGRAAQGKRRVLSPGDGPLEAAASPKLVSSEKQMETVPVRYYSNNHSVSVVFLLKVKFETM